MTPLRRAQTRFACLALWLSCPTGMCFADAALELGEAHASHPGMAALSLGLHVLCEREAYETKPRLVPRHPVARRGLGHACGRADRPPTHVCGVRRACGLRT